MAPITREDDPIGTTRLLCLHGCHGSGEILRRQIAPLAAGLSADIDLVFVDAPSLSSGDFGWWHEGLRGWERTREWAIELFSSQHFDGIFGFSQGAALAGMLAAVREAESAPLPFDLAIMVGGFTSTLPQHAHLFEGKLSIPSLHIMGRRDSVVPMRDSLLLAQRFSDPIVIEHGGGHVIPGDMAIAARIAAFVAHHAQVTGPGVRHG